MLGVFLNGDELQETTDDGRQVVDDSFLLLFNAHFEDVSFRLPNHAFGASWASELSTADIDGADPGRPSHLAARDTVPVVARSLLLLKRVVPEGDAGA